MAWGSIQIDPFDLLGLRQTYRYCRGNAYAPPPFQTPRLYRLVRHPIMLGLLVCLWAVPRMALGHLLFSAVLSGYILIGIRLEERDLIHEYGKAYEDYRRRVPMLLPCWRKMKEAP